MIKIHFSFFGYRFVITDKEADKYAEKLSKRRYGPVKWDFLPANHPRKKDFDFYVTPLQQFFFAFSQFLRSPFSNISYQFDQDGRPNFVFLVRPK